MCSLPPVIDSKLILIRNVFKITSERVVRKDKKFRRLWNKLRIYACYFTRQFILFCVWRTSTEFIHKFCCIANHINDNFFGWHENRTNMGHAIGTTLTLNGVTLKFNDWIPSTKNGTAIRTNKNVSFCIPSSWKSIRIGTRIAKWRFWWCEVWFYARLAQILQSLPTVY